MTLQDKTRIANSFSNKFDVFGLDIQLAAAEFQIFDEGVYTKDMDEKWNIFVLDNIMYWARSWTDTCIYKVHLIRQADIVQFEKVFVTRDRDQYRVEQIKQDKILFSKLLQIYLGRDDIYVDPAFQFELVKGILMQYEPLDKYIKSIGRQSVAINKAIYESILHFGEDYAQETGWIDFYEKIKSLDEGQEILSLYLQEKRTNNGTIYYMDNCGVHLLGVVVPVDTSSR